MRRWISALVGGLLTMSAQAAIRTEAVKYKVGETEFVGYLAYDDAVEGKRPGVVSFHGNLDTPNPDDAKSIKAKVLVCHGANDSFVPAAQVAAFMDEMRKAAVDWQMVFYGGAVHSFTNPASGNDPKVGVAYNAEADKRSWEAMRLFFAEIFAK